MNPGDREIDAEFAAHLAHRVDDLVAQGWDREEAEAKAREEFGDLQRLKAESRSARARGRKRFGRASRLDGVLHDLRFAARQLRRRPGFTATALATLAVGIGATVTIASLVKAVVLDPLPFDEPDRLVFVDMVTPEGARFSVSEPVFVDWERELRSFESITALVFRGATLRSPGQPRSITSANVSHRLLDVLGLEPFVGRSFTAEEDQAGQPARVAMISWESWRTDFGGDPSVVGSLLDLDGALHEVVGVMPERLGKMLTGTTPVFVPLGADPTLDREEHYLEVVARLADDTDEATASAELASLQLRISELHGVDLGWTTRLEPARARLIGATVERAGWVLLAAAAVLLLMACVNVANLLMVRATTRETEMSLRQALGASRSRMTRQLFTESALMAAGGGFLGVLGAYTAVPLVRRLGAARIPRIDEAVVDTSALMIGLGVVGVVTLACGIAPIVQLRWRAGGPSIGTARRGVSDPARRVRGALVSMQVAMTVVLLVGTGLLFRSFEALTSVDPGFRAEGTLTLSINMPDDTWDWRARAQIVPEVMEAVQGLPGVTAVGATPVAPFSGGGLANFVAPLDRMPDRASDFTPVHWRTVTPGFFEAMGMEQLAGRAFRSDDGAGDASPVVIGRSLAERSWPGQDAIGRTLVWGDPDGSRMTVVGVVEDLRDVQLGETPPMIIYRPYRQIPWATMTMIVRYDGADPASIAAGIRPRIAEVVPGLPIGEVSSLTDNLHRAVAEPRFNLQILSGFALSGLLLGLVGLYGLTAYDVRKRVPEIGIRLSLGARPRSIMALVMKDRIWTTATGILVGVGVAVFAARRLEALLYEVEPLDPVTWATAIGLVVAASALATYVPARGAMAVQPSHALNADTD